MCLILVCLVVLAVLIGWIGDLTASSQWQAGRQRALERIQKAKIAEFQSGYDFAVIEANAWDYYLKASETLDSLKTGKLDSLVFGKTFDPKEANRFLTEYKKEISLWDSGACSRYCRTPFEYEKGYTAPIPKYISLQKILKLALIKGRAEISAGRTQQGVLTYSKALKTAMDISGGSETVIARMVGIVAGKYVKRIIVNDIDRFDTGSIILLQEAIEKAEKEWPEMHASISMEALTTYMTIDTHGHLIEGGSIGRIDEEPMVQFIRQPAYSLLCWNHFFSLKRSMINFSSLQQKFADETKVCPEKYWSNIKPALKQNEEHIKKVAKGDIFVTIAMPNNTAFFKSEYELRMGLRVIKDALLLRNYRLKNGKYPAKLLQTVKDSPENNDIANGLPLRYVVNQDKTVWLYSVGLNLADDGGKNFVLSEGITRSTVNEAQDDIGIKLE
ncbi:MAG: hypothetical protein Q7U71_06555 [bacterium]|nr:hypothetical protein [bacterium]